MLWQQPDSSLNTLAERRNINEVLTTSTVSVSQIDTPPVLSAPVVTDPTELETPSTTNFSSQWITP